MGKNKRKCKLPQQKTPNISLQAVSLDLGNPPPFPEEMHQVAELLRKKKMTKALTTLKMCFLKYPERLGIRIRYADMLLARGERETAERLFNDQRDLATYLPTTKSFYADEYLAFLSYLGHLALAEQKKEAALEYHYMMYTLSKNDPRTRLLGKKIYAPGGAITFFKERIVLPLSRAFGKITPFLRKKYGFF